MKRELIADLLLCFILLIFCGQLVGQTAELQWEQIYGSGQFGNTPLTPFDYQADANGNIYILSRAENPNGVLVILVSKFNSGGAQIWQKFIEVEPNTVHTLKGMAFDADQNVLILGSVQLYPTQSESDIPFLIRLNPAGEITDRKLFADIIQSLALSTLKFVVDSQNNIFLMKLAQSGTAFESEIIIKKLSADFTEIDSIVINDSQAFLDCSLQLDSDENIILNYFLPGYSQPDPDHLKTTKISNNLEILWSNLDEIALSGFDSVIDSENSIYTITTDLNPDSSMTGGGISIGKLTADGVYSNVGFYPEIVVRQKPQIELGNEGGLFIGALASNLATSEIIGFLKKIAPNGDVEWNYQFVIEDAAGLLHFIVDANNNTYLGVTHDSSNIISRELHKIDANGSREWKLSVDRPDGIGLVNVSKKLILTPDGLIHECSIFPAINVTDANNYIKTFDSSGNVIWEAFEDVRVSSDFGEKLLRLSNGQFVAGGISKREKGLYEDILINKVDTNGQLLWQYIEQADSSEKLNLIDFETDDDGNIYIAVIEDYFNNLFSITKLNNSGQVIWHQKYPGFSGTATIFTDMVIAPNGSIYLCGYTETSSDVDFITVSIAANGTENWVRYFDSNSGTLKNDYAQKILFLETGRIIVTGFTKYQNLDHLISTIAYDTNGTLQWDELYNFPGDARFDNIRLSNDLENNIYVSAYPDGNYNDRKDAFVLKYAAGFQPGDSISWVFPEVDYGASPEFTIRDLKIFDNKIFITGKVGRECYLEAIDSLGNRIWKTTVPEVREGLNIGFDNLGNMVVLGDAPSTRLLVFAQNGTLLEVIDPEFYEEFNVFSFPPVGLVVQDSLITALSNRGFGASPQSYMNVYRYRLNGLADPPNLNLSIFANPANNRFVDLVLTTDRELSEQPFGNVAFAGDTNQVTLQALDEPERVFSGAFEFAMNGVHVISVGGTAINGVENMVTRTVNIQYAIPELPMVLPTPDNAVVFEIPGKTIEAEQLFFAESRLENDGYIARTSLTPTIATNATLKIYPKKLTFSDAKTFEILRNESGEWVSTGVRFESTDALVQLSEFAGNEIKIVTKKNLNDLEASVSNGFELFQNYPNPFNPTTNISFSLPQATDVSIRIFDLQGRLIREYNVAGNSAGMYKIQWDGKNNQARNVGSGFYFYQLSSENTTLVRKMLLIK